MLPIQLLPRFYFCSPDFISLSVGLHTCLLYSFVISVLQHFSNLTFFNWEFVLICDLGLHGGNSTSLLLSFTHFRSSFSGLASNFLIEILNSTGSLTVPWLPSLDMFSLWQQVAVTVFLQLFQAVFQQVICTLHSDFLLTRQSSIMCQNREMCLLHSLFFKGQVS